jgi:glycine/D-amino acid oxidase-like deaminating enzyme
MSSTQDLDHAATHPVFWQQDAPRVHAATPLDRELDVDVLIVGGGYTGLSTARALKLAEPGMKVAIIERAFVGFGASGRSSGYLTPLIGHDLHTLLRRYGRERGGLIARLGERATAAVEEMIARHDLDCDYEPSGLATPALSDSHLRTVDKLARAADELGVAGARWSGSRTRAELDSPRFVGAFYTPRGGVLQPFKLARELLRVVRALGVEVFEETALREFAPGPAASPVIALAGRHRIRARWLIMATNAYTRQAIYYKRLAPLHVYTIVTEPLTPAQLAALRWPRRVGYYTLHHLLYALRLTRDNRLLVATGNVRYFARGRLHVADQPGEYRRLKRAITWFHPTLAGLRVAARWEGVVGVTLHDLPWVGRHPRHANVLHSLAYNGHGVGFANLAGSLLCDLVLRGTSAVDDLPLASAPWPPIPPEPARKPFAAAYIGLLRALDALTDVRARRSS